MTAPFGRGSVCCCGVCLLSRRVGCSARAVGASRLVVMTREVITVFARSCIYPTQLRGTTY